LLRLTAKPATEKTGSQKSAQRDWQGSKPCSKRIGSGLPDPVRFVFWARKTDFPKWNH
jgi:hypothetical protein